MDQKDLELARLNAKLAVAKAPPTRFRAKRARRRDAALSWIVFGLVLGAGLGFTTGFSTVAAERFLSAQFTALGQELNAALR